MEVREATSEDQQAVVALWRAAGLVVDYNPPEEDFDRAVAQPQSAVLIGEADGRMKASCMVGDDGHRGWVYYVSVDPMDRGVGHGRAIMAAAIGWLKARGLRKAQLLVRPNNTKVLGFYDGVGWTEEPRVIFASWIRSKYPETERAS